MKYKKTGIGMYKMTSFADLQISQALKESQPTHGTYSELGKRKRKDMTYLGNFTRIVRVQGEDTPSMLRNGLL